MSKKNPILFKIENGKYLFSLKNNVWWPMDFYWWDWSIKALRADGIDILII